MLYPRDSHGPSCGGCQHRSCSAVWLSELHPHGDGCWWGWAAKEVPGLLRRFLGTSHPPPTIALWRGHGAADSRCGAAPSCPHVPKSLWTPLVCQGRQAG